jgi:hypothetical protein
MATLADVFRELNELKAQGVIREYALGGATAMLFYDRPTATYDVDVFILVEPIRGSRLVSLSPIYEWAQARGFSEQAEHVFIHGVPVQFLAAHNALAEDGVASARTFEYEHVPVRVMPPEHLAALAFQAGGASRRERAWLLVESGAVDRDKLRTLLAAHGIGTNIDDER